MAAGILNTRKHGTGRINHNGKWYEARCPAPANERGELIGRYPSRYQAQVALEKWLKRRAEAGR